MRLAMRMSARETCPASDTDPREGLTAEVIDLTTRSAYPLVAQQKGRSDALGLAAGVGFVALVGAATLWGLSSSRIESEPAATVQAPPPAVPFVPPAEPAELTPEEVIVPTLSADPAPSPVLAAPPNYMPVPLGNAYASPTVVFDASALPVPAAAFTPVTPEGTTVAAQAENSANDFAARVGGVGGGPVSATSSFDPKTTVTQGTMIPAVLETAINTDVPGYVRAVVSEDVRSFDGTRILVPRSSRLIGQYQSGLQAGQRRAYVIWTRLIRPDGVSVALASPGTAFDGSGGIPGQVNSHFFQRFGSAMLLSVIGGLTAAVSGGASVLVGGGQSAAATAVQQGGQIGPTVRVRPGEPIRVVTARDLDFAQAPRL